MAQPVKWYSSTMAGAPTCTGQVSSMINLLDACLVNGFNQLTLTSVVVASNVATATYTAHGYAVDQIVSISGATPSALNGEWRVLSAAADTFTFDATGIIDQTASGTIIAKTVSANWLKPHTGTNKANFRSQAASGSQLYLRVDDSVALYSTVNGYETMSDVDTGTNLFGTNYFKKSDAASSATRPWVLIADEKGFYLGVAWSNTTVFDFYHFGDFDTLIAGDVYNCRVQGLAASGPTTIGQYSSVSEASPALSAHVRESVCARPYSAIAGSVSLAQHSMSGGMVAISTSSNTQFSGYNVSGTHGYGITTGVNIDQYQSPNPGDGGYHFFPVYLVEAIAGSQRMLRGGCRGLLHVYETLPSVSGSYQILTGVSGITEGRVLLIRSAAETVYPLYPQTVLAFELGDWG